MTKIRFEHVDSLNASRGHVDTLNLEQANHCLSEVWNIEKSSKLIVHEASAASEMFERCMDNWILRFDIRYDLISKF